MQNTFKKIDFDKRKGEAERMLEKFPNRVPIIVLRSERSKLPELKQIKFLTPHDLTGECAAAKLTDCSWTILARYSKANQLAPHANNFSFGGAQGWK